MLRAEFLELGARRRPRWSAPTSYYAAVHATGVTSLITSEDLAYLLNRQTRAFQPEENIHRVEVGSSYFGRALGAIVGIKILIRKVDAKFKFGGNRTVRHRLRIAQNLAARGNRGDREAIYHLLRRTDLDSTDLTVAAGSKPKSP